MGRTLLWLYVLLASCNAPRSRGGTTVPPTDTDPTPGIAEFGRCDGLPPDSCADGLTCMPVGTRSFCVRTCAYPDGACPTQSRCIPQPEGFSYADGFCANVRSHYATCGGPLETCTQDALCASASLAPARCVPICDVGDLGSDYAAVDSCPPLPNNLTATSPGCVASALASTTASFCSAEVPIGAPCDGLALACSSSRADTDLANEPTSSGAADAGAPRCLPVSGQFVCLRVCSVDGGATQSPCSCPSGDSLCDDPTDPGLAWGCVSWSGLADGLWACTPMESCTSDEVCSDNQLSGLSHCGPSPYPQVAGNVCQLP